MSDIVPREKVSQQGVRAAGGVIGGTILLVLTALPPVAAAVAGAALVLLGLSQTRSKQDRRPGWVVAAVGAATLAAGLIPGLGGLAGVLLIMSGGGLVGFGAYNLLQFIRNLRRRM